MFTYRFTTITAFQRGVYVFTLVTSATTVALLVAPVAVHRLLSQRGRKRELVNVGHRMAISGLVSLAITMLAGFWFSTSSSVAPRPWPRSPCSPSSSPPFWAGVPLCVRRGPILWLRPGRRHGEADELDEPVVDTIGCRCSSGRPARATPGRTPVRQPV